MSKLERIRKLNLEQNTAGFNYAKHAHGKETLESRLANSKGSYVWLSSINGDVIELKTLPDTFDVKQKAERCSVSMTYASKYCTCAVLLDGNQVGDWWYIPQNIIDIWDETPTKYAWFDYFNGGNVRKRCGSNNAKWADELRLMYSNYEPFYAGMVDSKSDQRNYFFRPWIMQEYYFNAEVGNIPEGEGGEKAAQAFRILQDCARGGDKAAKAWLMFCCLTGGERYQEISTEAGRWNIMTFTRPLLQNTRAKNNFESWLEENSDDLVQACEEGPESITSLSEELGVSKEVSALRKLFL